MRYKQLGRTGLLVSKLCFGTMTFGGQGFWQAIGRPEQLEDNLRAPEVQLSAKERRLSHSKRDG